MTGQREHWASGFGFVMAAAGAAIGLGTLWLFPYILGENGGGFFLISYILCTILIGIPLFIGELTVGRLGQRGAVGIFMKVAPDSPNWKVIGWLGVLSSFFILAYYCVVAGWGLNYVLMSLNQFYRGLSIDEIRGVFNSLYASPGINVFWQFFFVLLTMGVIYQGIRKGIEYWSRILTSSLLFFLILLFCYSLTLDGFKEGFRFVFYPDASKVRAATLLEALGLSFFTMSLGQGAMLTYGSYLEKDYDIPKMSFVIGSMVIVVALFTCLMIFPIIFTFGLAPEAGAGLIFQTLPVLFAQLPGALFLSTLFFLLFIFTALTSSVSLLIRCVKSIFK